MNTKKNLGLPRDMIMALIDSYGEQMNPPVTKTNFIDVFSRYIHEQHILPKSGVEKPDIRNVQKALKKLIAGTTSTIKKPTNERLSQFWAPAVPNISPDWFSCEDIEEFRDLLEKDQPHIARLVIPKAKNDMLLHFEQNFVGKSFLTYRMSFSGSKEVARELLNVYESEGEYRFDFHFQVSTADAEHRYQVSSGNVLLLGENIYFLGVQNGRQDDPGRIGMMVFRREAAGIFNNYKLGIRLSSVPNTNKLVDRDPCASMVWLSKIDQINKGDMENIVKAIRFLPSDPSTSIKKLTEYDEEFLPIERRKQILGFISNQIEDEHILIGKTDKMNDVCTDWEQSK